VRFILDDYGPGRYLALGIPLWVSQTVMPVMWLVLGIRFMLQGFKNLISDSRG
jgi:TRAP-type C4-dicarboxylate transport system permease small subunit